MAIVENGCSVSTTYVWQKVKIKAAAQAQGAARAKRAPSSAPVSAPPRQQTPLRAPKHVQIRFRGGAETWWEITWGGITKRFPGHVALDDVLLCVFTHESGCRGHREQKFGAS